MHFPKIITMAILMVLLFFSCTAPEIANIPKVEGFYKPWEVLGPLFHDAQLAGVYPDSKTFADCIPVKNPYEIAEEYQKIKLEEGFELAAFVKTNFKEPKAKEIKPKGEKEFFGEHLTNLWDDLTRETSDTISTSTLIPLPGKYVVPGGRFREIYYWDSYFTMIGLGVTGREDLVGLMVDNFAYLIDSVGFIPNGNRTYYLGRSQPPFYAAMVNLLSKLTTPDQGLKYLSTVQKEYDFWMKGIDELSEANPANNRVVMLGEGVVLNRYYDFLDFPRPESHKEDFEMAQGLKPSSQKTLYQNLRAGAESGWDYSTRWFADKSDFGSIRTTEILPVDLNCLMYNMELTLIKLYQLNGEQQKADLYQEKALTRHELIRKYFWNEALGAFTDYIWTEKQPSDQLTMAGAFPLYFKIASGEQAQQHAKIMVDRLLLPGGFVTTEIASGQQWDYPNGWAPLQWVGIKGLEHYGQSELAYDIAQRWISVNKKVYRNTGKMMEKYNVADTSLVAGGGEYPTQDGFGWTNGVVLGLMEENPIY